MRRQSLWVSKGECACLVSYASSSRLMTLCFTTQSRAVLFSFTVSFINTDTRSFQFKSKSINATCPRLRARLFALHRRPRSRLWRRPRNNASDAKTYDGWYVLLSSLSADDLTTLDFYVTDQDNHLETLHSSLTRQHGLSLAINSELEEHHGLLEELDQDLEGTRTRLGGARKRLDKVAKGLKGNGKFTCYHFCRSILEGC